MKQQRAGGARRHLEEVEGRQLNDKQKGEQRMDCERTGYDPDDEDDDYGYGGDSDDDDDPDDDDDDFDEEE